MMVMKMARQGAFEKPGRRDESRRGTHARAPSAPQARPEGGLSSRPLRCARAADAQRIGHDGRSVKFFEQAGREKPRPSTAYTEPASQQQSIGIHLVARRILRIGSVPA